MNNQDYHVHHGQTFLTLQESLLTNFQLIRKDIVDPPRIQGYPSSKPSVSGSYSWAGLVKNLFSEFFGPKTLPKTGKFSYAPHQVLICCRGRPDGQPLQFSASAGSEAVRTLEQQHLRRGPDHVLEPEVELQLVGWWGRITKPSNIRTCCITLYGIWMTFGEP
mgnify:CR=1 FL=1